MSVMTVRAKTALPAPIMVTFGIAPKILAAPGSRAWLDAPDTRVADFGVETIEADDFRSLATESDRHKIRVGPIHPSLRVEVDCRLEYRLISNADRRHCEQRIDGCRNRRTISVIQRRLEHPHELRDVDIGQPQLPR
jgi:hypothetical protein